VTPDLSSLAHRLANITRRKMGERMAREQWAIDAGFRPGCVGVLRTVAALEPVSQREVSERMVLDPSDLVSLVDILEEAGLVERRRNPADRRRHSLEITPAGRTAVRRLEAVGREVSEEVLAPLDEDERMVLAHLLERVVAHHTHWYDLGECEREPVSAQRRSASARPPAGR
jgi:DNA-binding MarR family transcriptional regulator